MPRDQPIEHLEDPQSDEPGVVDEHPEAGTDRPDPEMTPLEVLVRRVQRPPTRDHRFGEAVGSLRARLDPPGVPAPPAALPRGVAVVALAAALVAGFVGWYFLARPAPIEDRMPVAGASGGVGGAARTESGASGGDPGSPRSGSGSSEVGSPVGGAGGSIAVHVAGSVLDPGLVELPGGSRVADAVEAAGGLGPGADLDRINLAATLPDGARVFVPERGEVVPAEVAVSAGGSSGDPTAQQPLNINTSDVEALEALPGVGPSTAAAIVAHREENGRFASPEGLLDVRGIGEAKLEAMRDLVTVG